VCGQTVAERERRRFLEYLRTLSQKAREAVPADSPETFSAEVKQRVRYRWNLSVSPSEMDRVPDLRPVVYVERGRRWVFDRELLMESFHSVASMELSELDRRMQGLFPTGMWRSPRGC
jgi:hypothetical protein